MPTFDVVLDELPLLTADEQRMDIGSPTIPRLFGTGAKRNIRLIGLSQLMSFPAGEILGNLGTVLVFELRHPDCIATARRALNLTYDQAAQLASLPERELVARSGVHPTPFRVRVDELTFPPPPAEADLEKRAQAFLEEVAWTEDTVQEDQEQPAPSPEAPPMAGLSADALAVYLRICARPDEVIPDRCQATGLDRARELNARHQLRAKGLITEMEEKLGKQKFYALSSKGVQLARDSSIQAKQYRYKSGALHEYTVRKLERGIGSLDTKFIFQRNSPIAREHHLQPDTVLHMPEGRRVIFEVCIHNLGYEARNLMRERQVEGVDLVVAVTPSRRLRDALQRAVDRCRPNQAGRRLAPLHILDAGQALSPQFDWGTVLQDAS